MSDDIVSRGGSGVPESDDLSAASTGLTQGYGQTKWVSERLILEAGRRGLSGGIVRPAYVVGDSTSAVTNTDDFLWRLVKGCIQLGHIPDIHNAINMVPVDHVARNRASGRMETKFRRGENHCPSSSSFIHLTSADPAVISEEQ